MVLVSSPAGGTASIPAQHPALTTTVDENGEVNLSDYEFAVQSLVNRNAEYRDSQLIDAMRKMLSFESDRIEKTIRQQSQDAIKAMHAEANDLIQALRRN